MNGDPLEPAPAPRSAASRVLNNVRDTAVYDPFVRARLACLFARAGTVAPPSVTEPAPPRPAPVRARASRAQAIRPVL